MEVEAGGAGVKTPDAKVVATEATAPGTTCPETGSPCMEAPQCVLLPASVCMCARWVKRIREEEIARRAEGAGYAKNR